ncbi:MAG TPA: PfkB family carbohydrate kinase, partial [Phnomibacter sp.]|nr:PfkB family carbohydrate kinase [Phnomibacter sp.]
LQRAMASHCFITFDPNYRQLLFGHQQELFKQHAWHYLKNCQFFKVSDEEALLLTATQHLTDAVTALKQATEATFAITLGKEGTLLCHNKQTSTIPSIPITPVDTTGAGDAFTGAVLRQLQQFERQHMHNLTIQQWQDIISKANKAGAHTCEYMGAMEAFRHLSAQILA